MRLTDLAEKIDFELVQGTLDREITGIAIDSRKVKDGGMFVCITGTVTDGHSYVEKALEAGAKTLVVEKDVKAPEEITVLKVRNTHIALAYLAKEWFGDPEDKLTLIGITGTKGKTTTAYMIKSILEEAGKKVGLIGTIETIIGDKTIPSVNTTPESFLLHEYLREMEDAGIEYVVMEVSSQAYKMERVAGITFDYGVFTNLEEDHIGEREHPTMEDYIYCKSRLFQNCRTGIVNSDADYLEEILKGHTCSVATYGLTDRSDFFATDIEKVFNKTQLGIRYCLNGNQDNAIYVNIPAEFSVYNSLAALAVCTSLGISLDEVKKAMSRVKVKGRMEVVDTPFHFMLMIDYAHNAMSLEAVLTYMRQYGPKRIIAMFGCGGNRSKVRRYEMGEVSARLADLTVVTSDNPRDEEPMDIISDILVGVRKGEGQYVVILDRREAIRYCLENGRDGDIIILAGKGHEDYQEIRGQKYHMDEREIIADILKEWKPQDIRKKLR